MRACCSRDACLPCPWRRSVCRLAWGVQLPSTARAALKGLRHRSSLGMGRQAPSPPLRQEEVVWARTRSTQGVGSASGLPSLCPERGLSTARHTRLTYCRVTFVTLQ